MCRQRNVFNTCNQEQIFKIYINKRNISSVLTAVYIKKGWSVRYQIPLAKPMRFVYFLLLKYLTGKIFLTKICVQFIILCVVNKI